MVSTRRVGPVVVVVVQPVGKGLAAFLLTGVAAGVGPAVSHRAVEAFDLAVSLRPVRPGELRADRQCFAGVAPQVGPVGAAIVGQDPLDGDATVGEPVHGPVQDTDCSHGGLVVVDLGVGNAGVVVDNRVDEGVPEFRVVPLAFGLVRGGSAVLLPLTAADVAPTTPVGDVPELLHIDVDERPGVVVLVAADRFAGGAVDVGEPVQTGARQDAMHR